MQPEFFRGWGGGLKSRDIFTFKILRGAMTVLLKLKCPVLFKITGIN